MGGTRLVCGMLGGACEPYGGGHLLGPGSQPVFSQKTPSSSFMYTSTHWLILFMLHVPSAWTILPAPPLAAPAHLSGLGWSITSLEGPSRTILFPVEPPPPTNTLSNLLFISSPYFAHLTYFYMKLYHFTLFFWLLCACLFPLMSSLKEETFGIPRWSGG